MSSGVVCADRCIVRWMQSKKAVLDFVKKSNEKYGVFNGY